MKQIEKQVDRIIVRLKQLEPLGGLRFVREYGTHRLESPVRGLLGVISIKEAVLSKSYIGGVTEAGLKGDKYSAVISIKVYAPKTENGSGLSETVGELMLGLREVDDEKIITDTGVSAIEFDQDMNAICRTVSFGVDFCLCEEASAL